MTESLTCGIPDTIYLKHSYIGGVGKNMHYIMYHPLPSQASA